MRYLRGPRYNQNCPFPIVANDPLSAEKAVRRCAACATTFNTRLETLTEDFFQIGMLTVLKALPQYDPNHSSGASLMTYMKKVVCKRLWKERQKELRKEQKDLLYPLEEEHTDDADFRPNPLVAGLNTEACARETFVEEFIKQLELEKFCEHLPQILAKLADRERRTLEMKYFEGRSGVEIAEELCISEGRVSQITKTALEKLKKAYLLGLEIGFDNLNTSSE